MLPKRLVLASPRGFCAGVRHAVDIVETALQCYPPPIYCLKELVHNRQVVQGLTQRGVVFVSEIEAVPRGACVLFSAHGVAPAIRDIAGQRALRVLDATCPFVTRLHTAVRRYARQGCHVLLIGHRQHDEIVGVCGEAPDRVHVIADLREAGQVTVSDPQHVAAVSQTTLDVEVTRQIMDVLRMRFPALRVAAQSDICFATHNRQKAARNVARDVELMLILGSSTSSNTRRLVEVCSREGCRTHLIETPADVDDLDISPLRQVGLTAGASTPDEVVCEVVSRLHELGFTDRVDLAVVEEDVHFALPRALRQMADAAAEARA